MANQDNSEEWRPVVGYEEYYHISRTGLLKRVKRGPATRVGKIQKPSLGKAAGKEYLRYSLCINNKHKLVTLHRVLYEAFVGPIPKGMHINHKNGVKTDNRLENLEVVTPSENTRHGFRVLGRKANINPQKGERHGASILTENAVREIRRLYATGGISQQALADRFGTDQTNVSKILLRKAWTHIE